MTMDTLTIMKKIEALYKEWDKKSKSLSTEKGEEIAALLHQMTLDNTVTAEDVVHQLSRFPKNVQEIYFARIAKDEKIPDNLHMKIKKGITESKKSHTKKQNAPKSQKPESPAPEPAEQKKKSSSSGEFDTLYMKLREDMTREKETVITALENAFETIRVEIQKSRETGAENVTLRVKISDLENQLSEQKTKIQAAEQALQSAKMEKEALQKQLDLLKSQYDELDRKLNEAYAINSREASLEAERIRLDLKKTFTFLYQDWLEYEFSDVSEDNYESLQAIITKVFRALERNGIDFKGNKE